MGEFAIGVIAGIIAGLALGHELGYQRHQRDHQVSLDKFLAEEGYYDDFNDKD